MAKIFISYRREDSQHAVDRLHAALKPYVDNSSDDIFIDVDDIPLGIDFAEYLDGKVAQCEILLAVIGPRWEGFDKATGKRRIEDPQDFVRAEIASALQRGIPVVPVLLDGAPVPSADWLPEDLKPLNRRNGTPLRRDSFESDVERMMRGLGMVPATAPDQLATPPAPPTSQSHTPPPAQETEKRSKRGLYAALAVLLLGGAGAGTWMSGALNGLMGESETPVAEAPGGIEVPITAELDEVPGAPLFGELEDLMDQSSPSSVDSSIGYKDPGFAPNEGAADAATRTALIKRLQSVLVSMYYLDGDIDGIPGHNTIEALKALAIDESLTPPNLQVGRLERLEEFIILSENLSDYRREDAINEARAMAMAAEKTITLAGPWDNISERDWSVLVTGPLVEKGLKQTSFENAKAAADAGNADAAAIVASAYLGYGGVSRNDEQAVKYFKQGCDGGNMFGCKNLGFAYANAHGVTQDYTKARVFFRHACEGGNREACSALERLPN